MTVVQKVLETNREVIVKELGEIRAIWRSVLDPFR